MILAVGNRLSGFGMAPAEGRRDVTEERLRVSIAQLRVNFGEE
jgi:hypothetical protein